jgi:hypothetical protein
MSLEEELEFILSHPDILIGVVVGVTMLLLLLKIAADTIDIRRF